MNYEKLIEEWIKSEDEWNQYRMRCAGHVHQIFNLINDELSPPDNTVFKMIDPDEKSEDKIHKFQYSSYGATKLTDCGWAKFGMYLTIQRGVNTWPKKSFSFNSFIKINEDYLLFKIAEDSNEKKISLEYSDNDKIEIIREFENVLRIFISESFSNWHAGQKE